MPPPSSTTTTTTTTTSRPTRQTSPSTNLSYLSIHLATPTTRTYQNLYIFIHGWACSATDYTPLLTLLSASSLAPSTLFIAPDLPGHGHSSQSICPTPTVSACARLINDLRHELSPTEETSTVLVGHSMGCRIALEAFSQQSAKVTGIVLLDGSWYGPAPTKDYKPASRSDAEELQNVLHVFDTMMGSATSEEFRQQIQRHLRHIDLGYAGRLRKDYIAWDGERMEEALGLVGSANGEVRVLVVQGTEGHGSKRKGLKKGEEGEWMKVVKGKVGEGYTGLVVEGTGHWPHVDKVQEVVDAIESFGMGS